MRKQLYFGLLIFLFTSCMTTKRYATFVNEKIGKLGTEKEQVKHWVVVTSKNGQPLNTVYELKKNSFIPAILYWSWNTTIECELSLELRTQYIKEGIYKALNKLNIKELFGVSTIEINLKEVPGKFLYEKKGDAIIFIIAYSINGLEVIRPNPINLEFEYIISNDDNSKIQRTGYILNEEKPLSNLSKSSKKLTWLYLDHFKKETERMGKEIVLDIIEILEKSKAK